MTEEAFEALLEQLRVSRGFDFGGYKRSTLRRRVGKRMQEVGIEDVEAYRDFLEVHPDEFALLFNTILINVTGFFRDPAAWDRLRQDALPEMLRAKPADEPIRVWSAGTASGEEAYSLAMCLADALGDEQFLERVKVYATDVDEEALAVARHGTYPSKVCGDVPPDLAERYLERVDSRCTFRRDLRRAVIFGRNDLVQDAPISRIDLLACRNTLMYFNAETQGRILRRLHFALRDDGVLFLGKSEMLITHADLFEPVDLKHRLFRKVTRSAQRVGADYLPLELGADDPLPADSTLRDAAWDTAPIAQILVDADGRVSAVSRAAREFFGIDHAEVGRRFSDLEISYRPAELRSAIDRAAAHHEPVVIPDVRWPPDHPDPRRLEVRVSPVLQDGATGVGIAFQDVTAQHQLREDLERSKRELETAYEELQSTVEELETTNEELQSTNEELETTNEELQSTNEELETMNEELQSTNEELETMNEELRVRTREVHAVNALLETIFSALGVCVIAVDAEGIVQLWNRRAEDMWGVRPDEAVGRHIMSLDIGLPLEPLRAPLRQALDGGDDVQRLQLEAVNRRGRTVQTRVMVMMLDTGVVPDGSGAILLVEEIPSGAAS